MNAIKYLKSKNVKYSIIDIEQKEIEKKWEQEFLSSMTKEEKTECYIYDNEYGAGFLWHGFSYEMVDCKEGNEASKLFNSIDKTEIILFFKDYYKIVLIKNCEAIDAVFIEDLWYELRKKHLIDIFVVDVEFKWTYVITHEYKSIPPFFAFNSNIVRGKS